MAGNGSAPLEGEALVDDLNSTEKSRRERGIANLRKLFKELMADLEARISAVEEAKRNCNGVVTAEEQEQVENIALFDGELSKFENSLAGLKIEENFWGDQVNELILDAKALIRKGQEAVARVRNIYNATLGGGAVTRHGEEAQEATGNRMNKCAYAEE